MKSSTPTDVTSKTGTDYNYSISPAQPAASPGAYLAFTSLIAGYWQVSVECNLTVNNILNGQVFFGEATVGPQDLTSALVTFSPNPITTGADKTTAGAVFAPVTATVSPNDLIGSVSVNNFNNQGAGRAAIENSSPNTSTGVIAFDVYGTVGTSVSMPNGDIQLEAKDGSTVLGTAEVTVEIPTAIGAPHPTFGPAAVTPTNKVLTAGSVPAFWGLGPNQVALATVAGTSLAVPVFDQFGNLLKSVYNGQSVYENYETGSFNSINADVQNGKYQDFVGPVEYKFAQAGSPAATQWATQPPLAIPSTPAGQPVVQTFSVRVAGFDLDPSVKNRSFAYNSTANTLTVTWP